MSRAYYHNAEVYCENCAPPGVEPEALPQETDVPENCVTCGRPVAYSLTEAGVRYVLEYVLEALDRWPEGAERTGHSRKVDYYAGSRRVDVVRDWAADLRWYGLGRYEQWLVDYFLKVTAPEDECAEPAPQEGQLPEALREDGGPRPRDLRPGPADAVDLDRPAAGP